MSQKSSNAWYIPALTSTAPHQSWSVRTSSWDIVGPVLKKLSLQSLLVPFNVHIYSVFWNNAHNFWIISAKPGHCAVLANAGTYPALPLF